MATLYHYILPHQLAEFEAAGWELVGRMRPVTWQSPHKDNLIVRKPA